MRSCLLALAMASGFTLASGLVSAQKTTSPRRPTPVIALTQAPRGPGGHMLNVSNYSVTPLSVTFTSSNPDLSVTGSSTTSVRFRTTLNPAHFTVYAKAGSANFTGCNKPPASGITVACSAPTGVTCAASAVLSNLGNGTTVATGSGNHNPATFTVTYTFTDGWNYQVGTGCSLSVSYIYTEP